MTYNLRGHKTGMNDPNMGIWSYTYNTLGQLTGQTDAKNQNVTLEYDLLGRLIKRTELEGISNWVYDTATKGIGKLASTTAPNAYSQNYTYDSLGRPSSTTTTINAKTLTQSITYDNLSRPDTSTYPTGFKVQNVYNAQGFLSEVKNAANATTYWTADAVNARGQVTQETLGNGLTTIRAYNNQTNRISGINTGNGNVQNLSYTFDTLGNLTERKDLAQNITDEFSYDNLNRLTSTTLNGTQVKTYQYDKLGNITFKSDVGNYVYAKSGNAGPNAVTSINKVGGGTITYVYDQNGNQISGDGRTLSYTSFNKPLSVSKGSTTNTYTYGSGRDRILKISNTSGDVNPGTTTTIYLGKVYEQVSKSTDSIIEHRHYIGAGGTTVLYTQRSNSVNDTKYLHKDHIGSTDAITNEQGAVIERTSFDAWGKRRNPNWTTATSLLTSACP